MIAGHVRFYGYRYYSPELGRWMSRDPLADVYLAAMIDDDRMYN